MVHKSKSSGDCVELEKQEGALRAVASPLSELKAKARQHDLEAPMLERESPPHLFLAPFG